MFIWSLFIPSGCRLKKRALQRWGSTTEGRARDGEPSPTLVMLSRQLRRRKYYFWTRIPGGVAGVRSLDSQGALFVPRAQGGLLVSGVLKMKRSLSFIVEFLITVGSCLAACIGCSSKNPPDPEPPRVIRWKGQLTGYESTSAERPDDNAGSTGQK